MKEFDAGKLANGRSFGDENYYFLVAGEDPKGQTFSFVTRGKGKQNAATRIPIRVNIKDEKRRQKVLEDFYRNESDESRPTNMAGGELDLVAIMGWHDCLLSDLELLYVVMPRYGNVVSGFEADAPGGTAKLGEAREQVADREFDEEADLSVLEVLNPFPSWLQFSSGAYDEIQNISFALVTGDPKKLVEGAVEWGSISLDQFYEWMIARNDPLNYTSDMSKFVPLDGKVVLAMMWFLENAEKELNYV